MLAPWVRDEMATADLADKRLNDRLREVLSQLSGHPAASIPAACGGRADMVAAYRLFDNAKATFEQILRPHTEATRERIAGQRVVLLVQDTSEIDVTRPEQQVVGSGPLDNGSRRGALLHLLHAFTDDGTPLGTVHGTAWTRAEESKGTARRSHYERAAIPIEEKESYRWVTTLRKAQEQSDHGPSTRVVCLTDSEADIYEYLAEATQKAESCDWIVRGAHDRALLVEDGRQSAGKNVRELVLEQRILFRHTVQVRGRKAKLKCDQRKRRQPRESREAELVVRAAPVTLRPPWRKDRKLPPVRTNVVLVSEVNPPDGDVPVEWMLFTSLPIENAEQVRQIVQYYTVRWMIEILFRVLKSGCRVEERRFDQMDRLLTCLAVYLIVAWRTLYVCRLGRSCPDITCEAIFEPAEWKSVWKVVRREDPPQTPPCLAEMVSLVAQLGGYVNRKRGNPPGPQTVWQGMQRMHDLALCWQLFGPEKQEPD